MALDIDKLTKALSAILTLTALGGQFAVYAAEIYAHIKEQSGLTDDELRAHREATFDATENEILDRLHTAGVEP